MNTATATKAQCPLCSKMVTLTKAGTFRVHHPAGEYAICPATGTVA